MSISLAIVACYCVYLFVSDVLDRVASIVRQRSYPKILNAPGIDFAVNDAAEKEYLAKQAETERQQRVMTRYFEVVTAKLEKGDDLPGWMT